MSYFSDASLRFFRGLARNNSKAWFEAHREEYERTVRQPLIELVSEMDVRLAAFAPEFVGNPKRSIFRLNRDIRFAKDKSPYKTHAACWFYHGDGSSKVGREAHGGGAGFYFHLEPGASLVGGGCWMPPAPSLRRIRQAIARDPRGFERIVLAPTVRRRLGALSEEGMLKRLPRGFEGADDQAAPWLKRTSFTLGRSLTDAEVLSPRLTATLVRDYHTMLPLVRWLNTAMGLPARDRR